MSINKRKNESELALAFDNVMTLVDIARKDILEIDQIIKIGLNGHNSILVDIDRVKSDIEGLEKQLDTINIDIKDIQKEKATKTQTDDTEKRLKRIERIVLLIIGASASIGMIISYGSTLLKHIK